MILSTWRITFDPGGPLQAVLLDYGDRMQDEILNELSQTVQAGASLFADWGYNTPLGGTQRALSWSRIKSYDTAALMRQAQILGGDLLPWNQSGTVRLESSFGPAFEFPAAVINSSSPVSSVTSGWRLAWSFRFSANRARAYAGIIQGAGIPIEWWTDAFSTQTFNFNGT